MVKVFIGIALVITLATAGLAFVSKGNIDRLNSTVKETKIAQNKAEGTVRERDKEVKKAQEDLASAKSAVEEKQKEVTDKTAQVDDLNKKMNELKSQIDEKEALNAKLKEDLSKVPVAAGGPAVDPSADLAILKSRAEKAEAELAEVKQVKDTMERKMKDNEGKVAALEQYKRTREQLVQQPGVRGRILAVNSGWNFVVLNIGDRQGLLTTTPLLVTRGGEPIAKVRVTSVEPGTSIADVIPASVRKGVTVQPGDNVVFEGNRNHPIQVPQAAGAGAEQPNAALPVAR